MGQVWSWQPHPHICQDREGSRHFQKVDSETLIMLPGQGVKWRYKVKMQKPKGTGIGLGDGEGPGELFHKLW